LIRDPPSIARRVSSPRSLRSSEGDQRQEEKLDAILGAVAPKDAEKILAQIDEHLIASSGDEEWKPVARSARGHPGPYRHWRD